jgi:putative membrane protein
MGHEENDMTQETAAPSMTSTDLALERTRLAQERTLMAWVRTATSMISFGFTVYKFFQEMRPPGARHHLIGSRELALGLTATGTVCLVLAMLQHRMEVKQLEMQGHPHVASISLLAGYAIALIGVVAFFVILARA